MLSEAVNVNEFFPLAFREHLIFGIVGVLFFLFQYYRSRKPYQVIMAIAIGMTFLLYLGEQMHTVIGIVEAVLMTLVIVCLIKDAIDEKKKETREKAQKEENDEVAKDGNAENNGEENGNEE